MIFRLVMAKAALLGLFLLCSCSKSEDPPLIRLVDLAGAARIESAVDLTISELAILSGADRLADGLFDQIDTARLERFSVPWIGPVLLTGQEAETLDLDLELISLPIQPSRSVRVQCEVDRPLSPHERLFVVELTSPGMAEKLGDADQVKEILCSLTAFRRSLSPAPGRTNLYETRILPAHDSHLILVGRVFPSGEPFSARLSVVQLTDRGSWLLTSAAPDRSPWVRSASVARVTHESLILGAPGRAHFDLRIPVDQPRLTTQVAPLFNTWDQPLRIEVSATAKNSSPLKTTVTLEQPLWSPIELDLTPFAGQEVGIDLAVDSAVNGALVAFGSPMVEGYSADARPDVILVSLDTARADRMSLYGYPAKTTPCLANLAASAVVFENAIAPAPWTLPSHISILSGQHPDRHGVHGTCSLKGSDTPWLAEEFRRAGYRTFAFTGGGYVDPEFGFACGFDQYGIVDPAFPVLDWAKHQMNSKTSVENARKSEGARAELMNLCGERRRGPRFLFVHTYAAHNYAAPPGDLRAVGAEPTRILGLQRLTDAKKLNQLAKQTSSQEAQKDLKRETDLRYDASLRVADRLVKDMVDTLRLSNQLDNTILVVLSDHGEELFERGRCGHGQSVFEEVIRVPLLFRVSDTAAARVEDVVSLVDVAPTLRKLCGLEPPGAATGWAELQDGRDLTPLLTGRTLEALPALARGNRRDSVFRAYRGPRLKLILKETPLETPRRTLFDLLDDPEEQVDRAAAHTKETGSLEAALRSEVESLLKRSRAGTKAELSAEIEQRLKSLGYL